MAIISVKDHSGPKKQNYVSKKTAQKLLEVKEITCNKKLKEHQALIDVLRADLDRAHKNCKLMLIGAGLSWLITVGGLVAYGHQILSP